MQKKVDEKVIVCCPLIALMQDQVQKMSCIPDFRTEYAGSSNSSDTDIKDGKVDLIYGSPEMFVGDPLWRESLQKLKIGLIVVDEFHTISTWGEDADGTQKAAFRKWFGQLGELRALCPSASVLGLSATCTIKIRNRVLNILNLHSTEFREIVLSPNRDNIKIVCAKVGNEMEDAMLWLIDGLSHLKADFPKTIIYCNSITYTSRLYSLLVEELPDLKYLFDMYHSEVTKTCKDLIIADLKDEQSTRRITIATDALGMGIDISNCHSIILYGAPNTAVDLVQRIGRASRDGKQSVTLILYNSYNSRESDSYVKDVIKTTQCRRSTLLSAFQRVVETTSVNNSHNCCDICATGCKCNSCSKLKIEELWALSGSSFAESLDDPYDTDTETYNLSDYEDEMTMIHHMEDMKL